MVVFISLHISNFFILFCTNAILWVYIMYNYNFFLYYQRHKLIFMLIQFRKYYYPSQKISNLNSRQIEVSLEIKIEGKYLDNIFPSNCPVLSSCRLIAFTMRNFLFLTNSQWWILSKCPCHPADNKHDTTDIVISVEGPWPTSSISLTHGKK